MNTFQTKYPKLHAEWVSALRSEATVTLPPAPAKDLRAKAAQVEANQEWEDEGGSIEASIKPAGTKPAPKIPL